MRWRWCLLSCWRQYRLLGHLCTGEVVIEMMDEQDDREVGMLVSKECILFSNRDNSRFRLNSLCPLCLWQCLKIYIYINKLLLCDQCDHECYECFEVTFNNANSATNVIMNAMSALRSHLIMQTMQPVLLLILPSKTFEDTLENKEFQAIRGGPD